MTRTSTSAKSRVTKYRETNEENLFETERFEITIVSREIV